MSKRDPDKPYIVYRIDCLRSGKVYIGISSVSLKKRWQRHIRCALTLNFRWAICGAIRKYGVDAFLPTLIYEAVNAREAQMVERGLIAQYGTLWPRGYNMTCGGELAPRSCNPALGALSRKRLLGVKQTPQHIANKSAGMMGHTVSPEARKKIGAANRGRVRSPEVVEAMRKRRLGKATPEHVKEKLRAALKGRKQSAEFVALRTAALRAAPNKNRDRTHCSYGHEYTPENTYVWAKRPKERMCKACFARRKKERRAAEGVSLCP